VYVLSSGRREVREGTGRMGTGTVVAGVPSLDAALGT